MMSDHVINVAGLDRYQAFQLCIPYMAHPDDLDRRERLKAWFEARVAEKSGKLNELSKDTICRLIEAAGEGVGNDLTDAAYGGCIAGQVLVAVLAMRADGVEDAGLDKAHHVVSKIYEGARDHKNAPLRLGRDMVSKHWKKYRTVAHLWAAYVTLAAEAKEQGRFDNMAEWQNGVEIAAIARTLQEEAAQCALPRKAGLLLPKDALRIEGIAGADWNPPELVERVRKALDTFTPRIRTGGK